MTSIAGNWDRLGAAKASGSSVSSQKMWREIREAKRQPRREGLRKIGQHRIDDGRDRRQDLLLVVGDPDAAIPAAPARMRNHGWRTSGRSRHALPKPRPAHAASIRTIARRRAPLRPAEVGQTGLVRRSANSAIGANEQLGVRLAEDRTASAPLMSRLRRRLEMRITIPAHLQHLRLLVGNAVVSDQRAHPRQQEAPRCGRGWRTCGCRPEPRSGRRCG